MTPYGSSASETLLGDRSKSTRARNDLTIREILAGLFCGALGCLSNTHFPLQTGYASETAMPASLIGFAIFRPLRNSLGFPFTAGENALVQSVAGAMSFMPATASFVGVIPALEHLIVEGENSPIGLSCIQLVSWPLGLLFFGCVFVVPFRTCFTVRLQPQQWL